MRVVALGTVGNCGLCSGDGPWAEQQRCIDRTDLKQACFALLSLRRECRSQVSRASHVHEPWQRTQDPTGVGCSDEDVISILPVGAVVVHCDD